MICGRALCGRGMMRLVGNAGFRMTILMKYGAIDEAEIVGGDCSGELALGETVRVFSAGRLVGEGTVDAFDYGLLQREPVWLQIAPPPAPDDDRERGVSMRVSGLDPESFDVGDELVSDPARRAWIPAQIPPPTTSIEFVDEVSPLKFTDRSYRVVNHRRFRIDPTATARDLLAALVTHEQYRDDFGGYMGRGAPIHGPYQLARIGLDSFRSVPPDQAANEFFQWATTEEVAIGEGPIVGDLDGLVRLIRESSEAYRLNDLGTSAEHSTGFVRRGLLEFIAIHRLTSEMHLLVCFVD
jgi:hypothetical protein